MQLRLHKFDLPPKHPFTIARGTVAIQQTLVVELSEAGHTGYGEATTNAYYGATYDRMIAALELVRPQLEAATLADPTTLWAEMAPHFTDCPFALCALDEAAHDLWGKKLGSPIYKLWGLSVEDEHVAENTRQQFYSSLPAPCSPLPPSCFTIGLDTIDRMVAKLAEMPGWPIYKIKLGTPDDLAIIRELRRNSSAAFRVDANCAWTADEALAKSRELADVGVEFIEQPLPASDWTGSRRVFENSALPIIADESCVTESDVDRCLGHFHGINIKLVKCGGLTPARRMIARARQLGGDSPLFAKSSPEATPRVEVRSKSSHGKKGTVPLKVMVGCMTESTVGISAIAQLLPLLDYVDMDGATLLASDVATGVRLDRGQCIYPAENGTGVQLLRVPSSP
jgi:L-alanine-DL-glutamate epimerase-like enolase superfamily enzyme